MSDLCGGREKTTTYLTIVRLDELTVHDQRKNPFLPYPRLQTKIFYHTEDHNLDFEIDLSRFEVVEIYALQYHCVSYLYRSDWVFIKKPSIGVKSVSRGQSMWM